MINTLDFNLYFKQLEEIMQIKNLTTVEIIQNNGYTAEVHNVITEDGYILELHRIPRNKNGDKPTRNHPVFLHHGILGSSADFVLGGAKLSLPMQLADDGYDVWLTNCRGNTYSEKHVSMTSEQNEFWNFSKHEIGLYDLPASIDYILNNTKAQQLHYIGFSMGNCVFFIMASEKPEYQPKIRSQISLAPIVYLSNMTSYIKYIVPFARIIHIVSQKISKGIFFPQSKLQKLLTKALCSQKVAQKFIYEKGIIFAICGNDPYNFDTKLTPTIMRHIPAGTSSKLVLHFAQVVLKNIFCQYDYGPVMNLQYYNSTCPPTYDLKSNLVPTTLIYAENDLIAVKKDVMRLKRQLPNLMNAFSVNSPHFNHVDFLWSVDVIKLVNEPIKQILEKTDDLHWENLKPNSKMSPSEIGIDDRQASSTIPVEERPPSLLYFIPILDYFMEKFNFLNVKMMAQLATIKNHWWSFQ